ncbi:MAG: hypothetical protein HYZ85_01345 [Candidatus Omnitrophica bacterium]|nr:hypothetical protein [Candidatus Omnitrophota bacterium]
MLIFNLNFTDIPLETRRRLEPLLELNEKTVILDMADCESFSLKGQRVERRIWKEDFRESISEARRGISFLLNPWLNDKTPWDYRGLPLRKILEGELRSIVFYRFLMFIFFTKALKATTSKRVVMIRNKQGYNPELDLWFEALKGLAHNRSLELLEIEIPSQGVPFRRWLRRGLKVFRKGLTQKRSNRITELGNQEKILAMGFDFPTAFELITPVFIDLKKDYAVKLCLSEASGEKADLLIKTAQHCDIPFEIPSLGDCIQLEREPLPEMYPLFETGARDAELWRFLKPTLEEYFAPRALQNKFRLIESVRLWLEEDKVKAVILPAEKTAVQRAACYWAGMKAIKTVIVPHYYDQFSIKQRGDLWHSPPLATQWAVLGEKIKEELIDGGMDRGRITVTGLPKFDICETAPVNQSILLDRLKIRGRFSGIFVWALQGFREEALLLEHLKAAMKFFPDKLLIVKPHPFQDQKVEVKGIKNIVIHSLMSMRDLISAAEMLLTGTSISAFEAILMGRPVLILNLFNTLYPYPFLEAQAAFEVTKPAEIVPTIKKILEDTNAQSQLRAGREQIRKAYGPCAGRDARQRLRDLILSEDTTCLKSTNNIKNLTS